MFEPKARNTDPITSHMAAESAKELARQHHARILQVLGTYGPCGVSQIAEQAELQPHQVGKRMKELEKEGLIALTGKLVRNRTGRAEREWMLSIPY
jgi:predicted ArsR family transcriptional regulator